MKIPLGEAGERTTKILILRNQADVILQSPKTLWVQVWK